MSWSWIAARNERLQREEAERQRTQWTGEAWRDHRSQFRSHHYAVAATQGVPYR
jgi:hypothetical protein